MGKRRMRRVEGWKGKEKKKNRQLGACCSHLSVQVYNGMGPHSEGGKRTKSAAECSEERGNSR
jgi:hypothetical protein